MELRAVLEALELLDEPTTVEVFTDSEYVKGVLQEGWNADANLDLIDPIKDLMEAHEVSIEWVEGHAGHDHNELADDAADAAREAGDEFRIVDPPFDDSDNAESESEVEPAVVGRSASITFLGDELGSIAPLPGKRSRLDLSSSHDQYPLLADLCDKHGATTIDFNLPPHVVLAEVIALAGEERGRNEKT
jgi:hypothetical protein